MENPLLSPSVITLLKKAFDKDTKEENYTIEVMPGTGRLPGVLGDLDVIRVTLTNRCSGEATHTIIKRNIPSQWNSSNYLNAMFQNEILFYEQIWKRFKQFQASVPGVEEFKRLPYCYGSCPTLGAQQLLFDNLRESNFQLLPGDIALNKEHLELVFETYGKYHAISFAYKKMFPEEYRGLVSQIQDTYKYIVRNPLFCVPLEEAFSDLRLYFEDQHADQSLLKKLKVYAENASQLLAESLTYQGNNSVVRHGDSWSGSIMFRYHKMTGKLTNLKLISFQLIQDSSPVYDLSYCFYSGADPKLLNELDHFLKIYHDNLSDVLEEFDLVPDEVYSYNTLKQEWKEYCTFGFLMGLILWSKKMRDENGRPVQDIDMAELQRIRREIILHMYQNNFL